MAAPSNAFVTYDSIGKREDLSDVIYNVAPTETPFLSSCAKVKATAVSHEWQTDTFAAAATNIVLEGDEATIDAVTATSLLTNTCQISDKTASITGTQEAVNKAGRNKEMAYQLVKKGQELKRDMELDLTSNVIKATGDTSVARQSAGLETWIATNDDFDSGGSSPTAGGTDARNDGTQRVFKESHLKNSLQLCFTSGGNPDCMLVSGFNKQKVSAFTGGSTRFDQAEDKELHAAFDVYVSDFGRIKVIPSRFHRSRSAPILQKDMWAIAYLRNMTTHDLAKTGDTERKQLLCEYTLEARNEAASGGVFDLTTS